MSRNNRFNSYLVENKIKHRTLLFLIFITWIAFTVFTTEQSNKGKDWIEIGLILSFFASFYIFYPFVERWIYKPWQNAPTQQEYTFLK